MASPKQQTPEENEVTSLVDKSVEHEKMLLEKYKKVTGRYSSKGCSPNEEDDEGVI